MRRGLVLTVLLAPAIAPAGTLGTRVDFRQGGITFGAELS